MHPSPIFRFGPIIHSIESSPSSRTAMAAANHHSKQSSSDTPSNAPLLMPQP